MKRTLYALVVTLGCCPAEKDNFKCAVGTEWNSFNDDT
jgi:hypothetical protein